MKLITERSAVLACLEQGRQMSSPLFCPNAETVDEIEGVLAAAQGFAEEHSLTQVTVGLGITASYPDHPQLLRLDLESDLSTEGLCRANESSSLIDRALIWLDWIQAYARPNLFPLVQAIPFLDHGWVPHTADRKLMEHPEFLERMGIIMYDASNYDLKENIKLTRDYVKRYGNQVVVEACPDKILSQAELATKGEANTPFLTDPIIAADFVSETCVDLIVPSLGTEHRGHPGEHIYYRRPLAQELKQQLGAILALHGTSSLGENISTVALDGICKVNFYTAMATRASQQLLKEWNASKQISISNGSGSYVHHLRRKSVIKTCRHMLKLLHSKIDS